MANDATTSGIQSSIDKSLSEDGRWQRDITILKQKGDASIPPRARVTLLDCEIEGLDVGWDCNIVICQSIIKGGIYQNGGTLTFDRCTFEAAGDVWTYGTNVIQRLCTTKAKVTIDEGSSMEAYKNVRISDGGVDWAIKAKNGSKVTVADDFFRNYDISITVDESSSVSARACDSVGVNIGYEATNHSQIEIIGGRVEAENQYGVRLFEFSTLNASSLSLPIKSLLAGLKAENDSMATVANSPGVEGTDIAIECLENSTVEIHKFTTIQGVSVAGIVCKGKSKVTAYKGSNITGLGVNTPAVYLDVEGSVRVRDVESVQSFYSDAIFADGDSSYDQYHGKLRGLGPVAIRSGDGCTFDLRRVAEVIGAEHNCFKLGNDCILRMTDVASARGMKGHGIEAGRNLKLEMTNVAILHGIQGDGIRVGELFHAEFKDVGEIKGFKGSGIVCGESSIIRALNIGVVEGLMKDGIIAGSKSDIEFREWDLIRGMIGNGIDTSSSRVWLKDGGEIWGMEGAGIIDPGSGGDVRLERIDKLHGIAGAGIRVSNGGKIYIDTVDLVAAGGKALVLRESSQGEFYNIGEISGGELGSEVSTGSAALFKNINLLTGSTGVQITESHVRFTNVKSVTGSPDAVYGNIASRIDVERCAFVGFLRIEGDTDVALYQVNITGSLEADTGVVTFDKGTIEGNVLMAEAVGKFNLVPITGTLVATQCAVEFCLGPISGAVTLTNSAATFNQIALAGSVTATSSSVVGNGITTGAMTLTDSGALLANSTVGGVSVSAGGIIAADCVLGAVALANGGIVQAEGTGTVTGSGGAFLAAAGTMTPPVSGAQALTANLTLYGATILEEATALIKLKAPSILTGAT